MAEKLRVQVLEVPECDFTTENCIEKLREWANRFPKKSRPGRLRIAKNLYEFSVTHEIDGNICAHYFIITSRKENSINDKESASVPDSSRDEESELNERGIDEETEG